MRAEARRVRVIAVVQVGDGGWEQAGPWGAGVVGSQICEHVRRMGFPGRLDGRQERKEVRDDLMPGQLERHLPLLSHQETVQKPGLRRNEEVSFLQYNSLNVCVPSKFLC